MSGCQEKTLMSLLSMTTSRRMNISQRCQHREKQTHSEILACGCDLLNSPKTISSDFGVAESDPEPRRFSMPKERSSPFPKSRKDRHKYIFGRTCCGLDSAMVDCRGSPGQNMRELSGCASHLRGERGLVKRTKAKLV